MSFRLRAGGSPQCSSLAVDSSVQFSRKIVGQSFVSNFNGHDVMKPALSAEIDFSRNCVLGIMDFGYAPYSLGDTMTWLTNLQITAHRHRCTKIDIVIVARPERPSSGLQRFITPHNYVQALETLFPAFLCAPMVRSIRVFERFRSFSQRIVGAIVARTHSWPSLVSHFREELDYSSHRQINQFYRLRGFVPLLKPPRGYESDTEKFRREFLDGHEPVIVNIRRGALRSNPEALQRDSDPTPWYRFFSAVERLFPSVVFVIVGGFSEWDRDLIRRQNIIIPRAWGYGLGVELSLLLGGVPFMGTSSGFSAAATFSTTPYVITNFESPASKNIGLPVGTKQYPFSTNNQWLTWEGETEESLLWYFERLRGADTKNRL